MASLNLDDISLWCASEVRIPYLDSVPQLPLGFQTSFPVAQEYTSNEMSVLYGATNTTIYNGVFTTVSNTVVNSANAHNDVVSVLLGHSATAGLLDAAERFDAPKCDDGTRTSMLLGMKKFVQKGGGPSIYWLHGPAGIGKSALAQSLALSLKDEGDHAASFFFSRTAPGRNDGSQLIATLACQLALSIPPIKPLLAKVVKENPLIFNATNAVKMQALIVDPLNQLHKRSRWNPRLWARRVVKRKIHPRLILVDGLDECNDTQVQRDLLICIGNAVRQLSLPFRFVITSRPESHILATFELDSMFHGPHAVKVSTKNLGDDEDADKQITTYLLKEFAEIRRTHPIREFLPHPWPLPGQIVQLVSKSSKGFIYPATVIRYIKMLNNRPDECLERILGLSEIPIQDKPYEPLDILYRYIFESVPDANKGAVRNIFQFLVIPNNLDDFITPRLIEKYYYYKPGHVQHVLRDLLCVVTVKASDHPIKVLHASLPEFLLNPLRSGPLCIDRGDAHTAMAVGLYEVLGRAICLRTSTFTELVYHLMHSNITERLLNVLIDLDPTDGHKTICYVMLDSRWNGPEGPGIHLQAAFLESATLVVAYLLALVIKGVPEMHINSHIQGMESYILRNYPLGAALHAIQDDIMQVILSSLRECIHTGNTCVANIYESIHSIQHSVRLVEKISKLHMLMMAPLFFIPTTKADVHAELADPLLRYPRLAHTLLVFLKKASSDTGTEGLFSLVVDLITASIALSGYSEFLISLLEVLMVNRPTTLESEFGVDPMARYFPKLIPSIGEYFDRVRLRVSIPTS